jgi:hypothetical protein
MVRTIEILEQDGDCIYAYRTIKKLLGLAPAYIAYMYTPFNKYKK